MVLVLEELDAATRRFMLEEFDREQSSGDPFVPNRLSEQGRGEWSDLMGDAIVSGSDETLTLELLGRPELLAHAEMWERNGVWRERRLNPQQVATQIGTSEFNTWYVRGLSARVIAEGQTHVEVYRASEPKWRPDSCAQHEGLIVEAQTVYDGHRAGYWPTPRPGVFSVPFQPGCHHSIRRTEPDAI